MLKLLICYLNNDNGLVKILISHYAEYVRKIDKTKKTPSFDELGTIQRF